MTNTEKWSEFLSSLFSGAICAYRKTTEYLYIKKQEEEISHILRDNLTQELVEDCLLELGAAAEREKETAYRQGIADCVWMLKKLGVLA